MKTEDKNLDFENEEVVRQERGNAHKHRDQATKVGHSVMTTLSRLRLPPWLFCGWVLLTGQVFGQVFLTWLGQSMLPSSGPGSLAWDLLGLEMAGLLGLSLICLFLDLFID